jgi:hypothetical protein
MKALNRTLSLLAVAALLVGVGACSSSDSGDGSSPPPDATTGVVSLGVITGFGSVYVNGIRYDTTGAQIMVNNRVATQAELKVGQCVQVQGHAHGAAYHADVIRYHNVIEGPISSIDLAAGSFVAMGQTVLVTSATSLGDEIVPASIAGLAVADVVEVSGMVSSTGVIEATRIDIKPDGGPYDVTGYVSNVAPAGSRFNINALVVDYSTANMADFPSGAPSAGDLVLVNGTTFNPDGSFVALHVELRSDDWLKPETGDELEVEGMITNFLSPTDFDVAGWPVTTTAATTYVHGTVANLANDVKVEVEGTADAAGVLVATKIAFKQVNTVRIVAQVEAVVAANRTIELLGLIVTTDDTTRFEDKSAMKLADLNFGDLVVGDWVEVYGYEDPAGSNAVTATRVLRIAPQDGVQLRGPFRNPVRPDFDILSVNVATTDATRFLLEGGIHLTADQFFTQAVDENVEAWGSWNAGTLTAQRVEIKDYDD